MKNYVHVGDIIEQERQRRQAQISKGIDDNVYDHIKKAHEDDLSQSFEKSENLERFERDIQGLNKAETDLLLHKIQRQLNADSGSTLLKAMKSIAVNHANDLEKATYVDNPQNRKLGRVGQQYGGKKETESMVNSEGFLNKKHPDAKRFAELDKKFDDKTTRKQMSDKELLEYDTLHRQFLSARKEWDDKRHSDSKKKIGGKKSDNKKDGSSNAEKEFDKLLYKLDDWSDEDWFDKEKNNKLESDIRGLIVKHNISEGDFYKMAKKHQGLDLVYTDFINKKSDLYKKLNK